MTKPEPPFPPGGKPSLVDNDAESSIDAMIADLKLESHVPSTGPQNSLGAGYFLGKGRTSDTEEVHCLQHELKQLLDMQEDRIRVAIADVVGNYFDQVKSALEQFQTSAPSSLSTVKPGAATGSSGDSMGKSSKDLYASTRKDIKKQGSSDDSVKAAVKAVVRSDHPHAVLPVVEDSLEAPPKHSGSTQVHFSSDQQPTKKDVVAERKPEPSLHKSVMKQASDISDFKVSKYDSQNFASRSTGRMVLGSLPLQAPRCRFCAILQKRAFHVLSKKRFTSVVAALILANAIVIGIQTDWSIKNIDMVIDKEPDPVEFRIIDAIFTIFFTCELLLRFAAEQILFFSRRNPNITWNISDFLIVSFAITEEVVLSSSEEIPSMSVARLLRVLRLVRVVRVIRVMRFFHDLRTMVYGIMSALKSLVWCIMLLLLIMFLFSCCMIQLLVTELADPNVSETLDSEAVMTHFGSMRKSLYTMHKAIFGGVDWGDATDPLAAYPILIIIFVLYITFSMLCVLNVVTGVFVENANKITQNDEDHMIMKEIAARQVWFDEVRSLFVKADIDHSGCVEWSEFVAVCEDVRVRALMRKMGVDIASSGTAGLFQLLDLDGDGAVNVDEFVLGIQQIHGAARSFDIVKLRFMLSHLQKKVEELTDVCQTHFQNQR